MIHTVLPGETLRGIAAMHGTGPDLLAAWNGTAEPLTGQELLVLHPQALHTVRRGESWQSLSARFGLPELRRCNPGPLRPGRRLVLGFRERGTRPLALCGTMGPEWNDLGLSYTCELAADAAELDGDGALHRLPLHGRPACLRLTGSGAKLETLLRSRAAQERLLLETAALCRACGTAQVELAVRDLLPDCDPAPLVSRLQALLAERGGGLTLALPRPGALGWEAPILARLAAAAGRVRAAPGLPGLPPERLLADYDDAAYDRCGLRTERLSRGEALALARRTGACLHYDAAKHLTCFSYRDETGAPHTVRFAGLRSWMERLRALEQAGVAALALRAPDPALCLLLHTQFRLR